MSFLLTNRTRIGFGLLAVVLALAGCSATKTVDPSSASPAPSTSTAAVNPAPRSSTPTVDPAPGARRQTVAVFPFENYAVEQEAQLAFMSDWVADSISAELLRTGELRVVEREKLLEILREQKLGASGLADPSTRATLGRISGAQTMIFGVFSSFGERFRMDARVVDTESGLVLKTVSAQGGLKDARSVTADLTTQLVSGLGLEIARETGRARLIDDATVKSVEAYYEGVEFERAGKTDAAIDAYKRSLELNPGDDQTRKRLKSLLL